MSEHFHPPSVVGNANDPAQRKRVRTGSISGRLRTASDLEEIGMIDKYQKGYIKDLIISGDSTFQAILEKYEKGDKKELEELIRSGCLGRRQSIDLLDDLDFDFLNGMKTDLDVADAFGDDFMFDFAPDAGAYGNHQHNNHNHVGAGGHAPVHSHGAAGFTNLKARTASMDSTGSFSFFENLPYDANNANSLMDELQYLNRQYADTASAGPGPHGYPARHVPSHSIKSEPPHKGSGDNGDNQQAGAPHVSFSRYVSSIGLDPASGHEEAGGGASSHMGMGIGGTGMMSGHKGRRDSWDIAAQYIQQEEDFSRGQCSAGGRGTGSWAASMPAQQPGQPGKGGAAAGQTGVNTGTSKSTTVKKSQVKMEGNGAQGASSRPGGGAPGSSSTGSGTNAQAQGAGGRMGAGGNAGGGSSPGTFLPMSGGGGSGLMPQQGQGQQRPLSTTGGTSTSTQHSSYLQQGQMQGGGGGGGSSSGGSLQMQQQGQGGSSTGSSFDDIALRLGGPGFVGAYSPEQRRMRIEKFIEKRGRRVWTKKVKYDVRKNFADSRLRVKGRFVKKEDEDIMREILSI